MTPHFKDVEQLPVSHRVTVPDDWTDVNGHMNVRHYLGVHDTAVEALFSGLGFDQAFVDTRRRSFFDLEHHLEYHREVLQGDQITAHVRVLGRSAKVVHAMSYVLNRRTREVASTMECATAHVDLVTRRTVALLDEHTTALDATVAEHAALAWQSQTCGVIGVSKKR
jgi:acyl-CoA thioesterase FadM